MVQVLPYVPSFGEQLVPALGNAIGNIAQGYQQRRAQSALQQLLTPQNNPIGKATSSGLSPLQEMIQRGVSAPEALNAFQLVSNAVGPEGAKVFTNTLLEQSKLAEKEAQQIRKEEREVSRSADKSFFDKVDTDKIKIPDEQLAADMILDAIKSGEIDPFSSAHISEVAQAFGAPAAILKGLETPGSKEFKTARKTFIGNTIKDAFRGTTTKIEINLAEDMLAELGVSREANLASAWGLQASLDIRKERLRIFDELREKGVPITKIPAITDKMLQPYIKETKDEYFSALRTLKKKK